MWRVFVLCIVCVCASRQTFPPSDLWTSSQSSAAKKWNEREISHHNTQQSTDTLCVDRRRHSTDKLNETSADHGVWEGRYMAVEARITNNVCIFKQNFHNEKIDFPVDAGHARKMRIAMMCFGWISFLFFRLHPFVGAPTLSSWIQNRVRVNFSRPPCFVCVYTWCVAHELRVIRNRCCIWWDPIATLPRINFDSFSCFFPSHFFPRCAVTAKCVLIVIIIAFHLEHSSGDGLMG